MTKYIKGKDGKFAGSIGSGKTSTPSPAPAVPQYATLTPDNPRAIQRNQTAQMHQLMLHEEIHRSYEEIDQVLDGRMPAWVAQSRVQRLRTMADVLDDDRHPHQAEALRHVADDMEYSLDINSINENATGEGDAYVAMDTSAMYQQALNTHKEASQRDFLAVDDDGEFTAKRSFRAYSDFKTAEHFPRFGS